MKNWICVVAAVLALGRVALAAMDANTAANIRDIQLLNAQLINAKSFSNLSTSAGTVRATKLGDTVTFKGYSGVTASASGKVFRLSTPSLQSKALQSQYSSHRAAQWSTLDTAAFQPVSAFDTAGAAASVTTTTIGAVPTSRTINGYDLTANRSLAASDVGAPSGSGSSAGTNTGDVTLGTANGLSLSGQSLSLQPATNSQPGALTAADHTLLSTALQGLVSVTNGGTGTSTGSITGSTALAFAAGGSNQNITLTPSGSGYSLLNGNVGIGTTSPSSALEIGSGGSLKLSGGASSGQGNIQLGATANSGYDTNLVYLSSTAMTGGFIFGSTPVVSSASGPFFAARGNTYSAIATQRGNMFIGAGNPSAPAAGEGQIGFYTGATALRMVIDKTGNVGIGTTAPGSTLTVVGTVSVNAGANVMYWCNGTITGGNLCRGNGCSGCVGTWTATSLSTD